MEKKRIFNLLTSHRSGHPLDRKQTFLKGGLIIITSLINMKTKTSWSLTACN